jgi:hypothetical protein
VTLRRFGLAFDEDKLLLAVPARDRLVAEATAVADFASTVVSTEVDGVAFD